MIKWQITLCIIGLLWLLLFFVGIPLDIAHEWTVSLALLGSLVWLAILFAFFFVFSSREEVSFYILKFIIVLVAFFGFAIAFIFQTTQRTQEEWLHHGILCRGKILMTGSTEYEHDQQYPISIRYAIDEKNTNTIEANLVWQTINNEYFNWYVPVVYSKKYPLLATALLHKNEYKKYAAYFDTLNVSLKEDFPFIDTSNSSMLHNISVLCSMGQDASSIQYQLKSRYTDVQIDSILHKIPVHISPAGTSANWPVLSSLAAIFSVLGLLFKFFERKN